MNNQQFKNNNDEKNEKSLKMKELLRLKRQCEVKRQKIAKYGLDYEKLSKVESVVKLAKLQTDLNAASPTVDSITTAYIKKLGESSGTASAVMSDELKKIQNDIKQITKANNDLKSTLKSNLEISHTLSANKENSSLNVTLMKQVLPKADSQKQSMLREVLDKINELEELNKKLQDKQLQKKVNT